MSEVTIEQILAARERRVEIQKLLITKYQKPIISYTMNIAGPEKNSRLIERGFFEGLYFIKSRIPENLITYEEIIIEDTGCEAFFSVDTESSKIKNICKKIEEETALGRLFDMDVIDIDGKKLCRKTNRCCIVCGAEGRGCAAGRLHSVSELRYVTQNILNDYFLEKDTKRIADLAVKSLIDEVSTTPKPGLVDKNNSGSHKDMNFESFIKSANALQPYFSKCFKLGHELKSKQPDEVFQFLKNEGIVAENTMYSVTGGANTHKGIIYSMGIICGSLGRLWKAEKPFADLTDLVQTCSQFVKKSVATDFETIDNSTAGGLYYHKYGIKGIRGEVLSGFSSVTEIGLPTYTNCIKNSLNHNDAGVFTLLKLISQVEDTNLYNRGGKEGAEYASKMAASVLKSNLDSFLNRVYDIDNKFIKRNLSPGGCADLLAITYFLYSISNEKGLVC